MEKKYFDTRNLANKNGQKFIGKAYYKNGKFYIDLFDAGTKKFYDRITMQTASRSYGW